MHVKLKLYNNSSASLDANNNETCKIHNNSLPKHLDSAVIVYYREVQKKVIRKYKKISLLFVKAYLRYAYASCVTLSLFLNPYLLWGFCLLHLEIQFSFSSDGLLC